MDFRKIYGARIPEGEAFRIRAGGVTLWTRSDLRYVSFGDSIAAGHAINAQWETEYGVGSQYGENGNTSTVIVPGSYADLLRKSFEAKHGAGTAQLTSFAHSGDTVQSLIDMLNDAPVKEAVAGASLITVCIGANDILGHVNENSMQEYATSGSLANLEAKVKNSLGALPSKYRTLFNKLTALNPRADVVFTTIYNPYKYLWIEEGQNGFFKPVLDAVPSGLGIDLGFVNIDITSEIKNKILDTDPIKLLFSRINGLDAWVETYVTMLNDILREQINAYNNPHIMLADTKAVFDPVPDRTVTAEKHYDELVNVEFTRGFDVSKMDWGQLYEADGSAYNYWYKLIRRYMSGSSIDWAGMASVLVDDTRVKVILPDIDPHPEAYGQYALSKSFEDTLGWSTLPRRTITYRANGGGGEMSVQTVVAMDGLTAYVNLNANGFTPPGEGYYWNGWKDQDGNVYSNGQLIGVSKDLELTAQWSNMYTVVYRHTNHTNLYGSNETGHMECYALYINGELKPKFGTFADGSITSYRVPYGATIRVVVSNYNPSELTYDDVNCDVYRNGISVASGYRGTEYTFKLKNNVDIDFRWKIAGSIPTFDARSWEDCYIEDK